MHKLALLFVHFCCLLSRISIPSVKRRCNLSHLSLFHKYIEIMKGLYIVRTLSLSSIYFRSSISLRFCFSPRSSIGVSSSLLTSLLPLSLRGNIHYQSQCLLFFRCMSLIQNSRYFKMQRTFSQYRILLKRRSTCRLETLRSHITQTSLHKSSGKRRLN